MKDLAKVVLVSTLIASGVVHAEGETASKNLYANFVYQDELGTKSKLVHPDECQKAGVATANIADIAVGVIVALVGKVAESVIDATAAKMQSEQTTYEATTPLEGFFYNEKIAVSDGCLVVHNGINDDDATGATFRAVFQTVLAPDNSAFRFVVRKWEFTRFLSKQTHWFQGSARDLALKIEFLSPSSSGLGNRSVFIEKIFPSIEEGDLRNAYREGQSLPWFSVPSRASNAPKDKRSVPLNIQVTLIETTKPTQFAQWMQDLATSNKGNMSKLFQDEVRKQIDPVYKAKDSVDAVTAASKAYEEYSAAYDSLVSTLQKKPDANATKGAKSKWNAELAVNKAMRDAKRVSAKAAYDSASLPWPGDLELDDESEAKPVS